MDKELINEIVLASGLEHKKLDDGSMGFRPYIYSFVKRIESHLAHKYDQVRKKDQQDLIALRQKVQSLAGENIKLRAHIKNARECLDEVSNG